MGLTLASRHQLLTGVGLQVTTAIQRGRRGGWKRETPWHINKTSSHLQQAWLVLWPHLVGGETLGYQGKTSALLWTQHVTSTRQLASNLCAVCVTHALVTYRFAVSCYEHILFLTSPIFFTCLKKMNIVSTHPHILIQREREVDCSYIGFTVGDFKQSLECVAK